VADLSLTKTDGVMTVVSGGSVTYTIAVTNAGPDSVVGATVADSFPTALTCLTSCSGTGGATCTPGPFVGSFSDVVDIPAGESVTYTSSCSLSPSASGSLTNTATVTVPSPVIDPNLANNSATDVDTILPPPTVTTNPATLVGPLGATLNGTVNPNGSATQAWFEYGPTTSYGNSTTAQSIGSGSTNVAVSQPVTGLACTTLHFRAVGMNASGTTYGNDLAFTTGACLPSRTFVSVLGLDTNDCSNIATPCRTLGAAIAQVAVDGGVIVIKSGSYAGATIAKGVKIDVASGVVAFSGQPIVVNPGAGVRVVVRGLTLKAVAPGTGTGIDHQSGDLFLERTVVDGWQVGVLSSPGGKLFVTDSTFRNNPEAGVAVESGEASVESSRFLGNGSGLALQSSKATVSGSVLSGNAIGLLAVGSSEVSVEKAQLSLNGSGVLVPEPSSSTVRLNRCVVTGNDVGLQNDGGTIAVTGTNAIRGNTIETAGTITTVGLQ
jgi:uncharacterized repeat protein (TIGR01451 family)